MNTHNIQERYLLTEDGRIWSFLSNKYIKVHKGRGGYSYVWLVLEEGKKFKLLHRLLAEAFIPNPRNLAQVNHKDGQKSNNSLTNLEWCTPSENVRHAHKQGLVKVRSIQGASSHKAKLREEEVREFWRRIQEGESVSSIHTDFPAVKRDALYSIKQGKSWNNITGLPRHSCHQKRKALLRNVQ